MTEFLRQQGYQVIDTRMVVHELQEPGGQLYQALYPLLRVQLSYRRVAWTAKLGAMILGESRTLGAVSQRFRTK